MANPLRTAQGLWDKVSGKLKSEQEALKKRERAAKITVQKYGRMDTEMKKTGSDGTNRLQTIQTILNLPKSFQEFAELINSNARVALDSLNDALPKQTNPSGVVRAVLPKSVAELKAIDEHVEQLNTTLVQDRTAQRAQVLERLSAIATSVQETGRALTSDEEAYLSEVRHAATLYEDLKSHQTIAEAFAKAVSPEELASNRKKQEKIEKASAKRDEIDREVVEFGNAGRKQLTEEKKALEAKKDSMSPAEYKKQMNRIDEKFSDLDRREQEMLAEQNSLTAKIGQLRSSTQTFQLQAKKANESIVHKDLTPKQLEEHLDRSFKKLQELEQRIEKQRHDPQAAFPASASSDRETAFSAGRRSLPAGRLVVPAATARATAPAPVAQLQTPTLRT